MNFIPPFMKKISLVEGHNGREAYLPGASTSLCDASQFHERLTLERKRAERSRRPFILMLLDITLLVGHTNGNNPVQIIADWLATSTREVDGRGWYENDAIIGVVFSEFGGMGVVEAKERIHERVSGELRSLLYAHQARFLGISFSVFPEYSETTERRSASELKLLPDLLA